MGWCSRMIVGASALCVSLAAPAATEDPPGRLFVALEYEAASDCPDVSAFQAFVVGRLRYDPFREAAPDRVIARIAVRGTHHEGRIEWRDAEGEWAGDRSFSSPSIDCRDLARAMAFALALQIQLSAGAGAPSDASAAPAEDAHVQGSEPPPALPPAMAVTSKERQPDVVDPGGAAGAPERGPRPVLAMGAGALVGFGLSPSPVPVARLFGSIAWPRWSVELATELGWPSTARREDGAGFSEQELLLDVAGCGALAAWSTCLVAKAGAIRIQGKDIDAPASHTAFLFETGLRLAFRQPLGRRFHLSAKGEGLVLVTRRRVTLDENLLWTSPRFAGTLGVDLGVSFP